jgi:predicted TIM-barrel fold metal-dependent hydrolase
MTLTEKAVFSGPLIDATVHHHWSSQNDVQQYMSEGWQVFLGKPRSVAGRYGQIPIGGRMPFNHPIDNYRPDTYPNEGRGAPGSSYEMTKEQVLDAGPNLKAAVLTFDGGMWLPRHANHYLSVEACRAANDWNLNSWLQKDERLYGLALVANNMPDEAAAEVRRIGANERIVGVIMTANGLDRPFGNPIYHPIYEAASEMDLPIVFHFGGDDLTDIAGGLPKTQVETRLLSVEHMMGHFVSLIGQGVFVKYPNLKVLFAGTGVGWVPSIIWRFNNNYKAMRREAPWLTDRPSDYLHRHFYFTTWPLDFANWSEEDPKATERMQRLMHGLDGMDDMLVFGSGYPYWDCERPTEVAARLPEAWWPKVFHDNADKLFRFGKPRRTLTPVGRDVGAMG